MAQRTRPVPRDRRKAPAPPPGKGGTRTRRRRRMRFDAPPPRPFALSGWALLPLRAFLGFTFCFAGLQKLANPNFFNANSPVSIQAQLIASNRISPLHLLLGHLIRFAVPIGIVIALAEIAVGLGALLGLWTRVAAAGGMVLALMLFLTVSFHSSPYFTGADIVFFFAWIPLLLAGSGGVLSLDAVIDARGVAEHELGPPTVVPIRFDLVQRVCGHYEHDTCTAQEGRRCDVYRCPFLADERGSMLQRGPDAVDRRKLVIGGTVVAASAVVGAVAAGAAAGLGRAVGGAKSPDAAGTSALSRHRGALRGEHHDDGRAGRADDDCAAGGDDDDPGAGWHEDRSGQPGPGGRGGHLHGPGHGRPRSRAPTHPGPISSPTTRSARMRAARSGTRAAPGSSSARAMDRSSTLRRVPWSAHLRHEVSRPSTSRSSADGQLLADG